MGMSVDTSRAEELLHLAPAEYVDSDHPAVETLAGSVVGDPRSVAREHYRFVRDEIRYDPYVDYTDLGTFRASAVLARGSGYCVGKASLYAALCRASGIPARIGLADVRNHLATPRLLEAVGSDLFAWHGFVEVKIGDAWLKASPTFNLSLCERLGVEPLAFDGESDAMLQPFDATGRTFMTYERIHGSFFDVPAKCLVRDMARLYPRLCVRGGIRGEGTHLGL
jgi:transglutaminase-like putative cysteine protease